LLVEVDVNDQNRLLMNCRVAKIIIGIEILEYHKDAATADLIEN